MADSEAIKKLKADIDKLGIAADAVINPLDGIKSALVGINNAVLTGEGGFAAITGAITGFGSALASVPSAMAFLTAGIPGLGKMSEVFTLATESTSKLIKGVATLAGEYGKAVETFDEASRSQRELSAEMFSLGARFGENFDAAQQYRESLLEIQQTAGTADFGWTTAEQLRAARKGMADAGLGMDVMFEKLDIGGKKWDAQTLAVQHAASMGMEITEYTSSVGIAMLKQGKSLEEAAEQMAMFQDVAKEVGLPVSMIARTLNGAVDQFTKLGMTADIAKPLLTGFARSLGEVGLGIENSTDLASKMTAAIGSLTQNYGMAYLTFQRGGLDIGGGGSGGVLGAGIQMQAKMLEAEKTGDQAKLGQEIAQSMGETIKSFTGGRLVSVQEAAKDPRLEQTFYTQTKLLEQMYGIQGTDAARTIEMLQGIEGATAAGDKNLADSLAEDLANQTDKQDKTVDESKKMNITMALQLAEQQQHTQGFALMLREISAQGVLLAVSASEKLIDTTTEGAGKMEGVANAIGLLNNIKGGVSEFQDMLKSNDEEGIAGLVKKIEAMSKGQYPDSSKETKGTPSNNDLGEEAGDDIGGNSGQPGEALPRYDSETDSSGNVRGGQKTTADPKEVRHIIEFSGEAAGWLTEIKELIANHNKFPAAPGGGGSR